MENQGFLDMISKILHKEKSKKLIITLIVIFIFLSIFCRFPTSFKVFDSETGKPIEGTVAIAMWDRTRGFPGLSSTYTAKAIEAESDENGIVTFPFLFGRAAIFTPHIKFYKPGYVGWDSKRIYLGCYKENSTIPKTKKRNNFSMSSQDIFLENWEDEYTFISHYKHINAPPDIHKAGIKGSKYKEAIKYEDQFRGSERRKLNK